MGPFFLPVISHENCDSVSFACGKKIKVIFQALRILGESSTVGRSLAGYYDYSLVNAPLVAYF